MSLIEHVAELRRRLLYCFVSLLVGFLVCYNFAGSIINFLMAPLADIMSQVGGSTNRMIYTDLTEGFFTHLKAGFFGAIIISVPVFIYNLWAFVAPGLYKDERKAFFPFLLASPILFMLGASLVYFGIIPLAWKFLLGFQASSADMVMPVQLEARVADYLSLIINLIIGFGVCFQMPLVIILLVWAGLISVATLVKTRRYAVVTIFVISAFATPPDVISQIGLALPLLLLYEVSLFASSMVEKRRERQ